MTSNKLNELIALLRKIIDSNGDDGSRLEVLEKDDITFVYFDDRCGGDYEIQNYFVETKSDFTWISSEDTFEVYDNADEVFNGFNEHFITNN